MHLMPSLATFFRIFICAGLGVKIAVITASFHPLIGAGVGAVIGFATLPIGKGSPK
jgi:hypothetical protein